MCRNADESLVPLVVSDALPGILRAVAHGTLAVAAIFKQTLDAAAADGMLTRKHLGNTVAILLQTDRA